MSIAQPIRSNDELNLFKEFYLNNRPNVRNYALICIGLNSALRISDVLQLRWEDVYDFKNEHFLKHIIIIEKKTNKNPRENKWKRRACAWEWSRGYRLIVVGMV